MHSGSDKFSIYKAIYEGAKKFNAGVHLKTAGTNWLEELIGLAESAAMGWRLQKMFTSEALAHKDELDGTLCDAEIDIDDSKLPSAAEVNGWTGKQACCQPLQVATNRIRRTTQASGNCCTWVSRSRRRWGRGTWKLWKRMRMWWRRM